MFKRMLVNLIKIKLEAFGLMAELLPEPIKKKTVRYQRELLQVVHQVTGEYLAGEHAEKAQTASLTSYPAFFCSLAV